MNIQGLQICNGCVAPNERQVKHRNCNGRITNLVLACASSNRFPSHHWITSGLKGLMKIPFLRPPQVFQMRPVAEGFCFFFVFPTAEFLPPCHVPRLLYDVTRPSWGWHHVMFPAPLDVSNSANVLRAWKVQWNKHSRILSTTTDSLLPHMGLEIEIEIIPRLFVFSYIKQYQLNSTTTHEYL